MGHVIKAKDTGKRGEADLFHRLRDVWWEQTKYLFREVIFSINQSEKILQLNIRAKYIETDFQKTLLSRLDEVKISA